MKSIIIFAISLFLSFHLNSQISFTLNTSICKYDTAQLASNTGSLTNCTFTWVVSPNGGYIAAPNSSATTVTFSNSTSYTITLTVLSGTFLSSYQNTIIALPLPTITLGQSSFTTCIASNFPFFAKQVHLTASGGQTYTWNPFYSLSTGNPNGPINDVRPTSNSCFSVSGSDNNGCRAMASVCLTVIPRFSIPVNPTATLMCKNTLNGPGQLSELIAGNPTSPAFGHSNTHLYSWMESNLGTILTPVTSPTIAVSPQVSTTYTAQMLDSLKCISLPAIATVSVQNCLGISSNSFNNFDFKIYPNPVSDKLFLSFASQENETMLLSLYSPIGQLIFTSKTIDVKELEVRELKKGIYYLKVQIASEQKVFKILKD